MSNPRLYFKIRTKWEKTGNPEFPFQTTVDEHTWVVRINDFPEKPLFTLLVDNEESLDFDEWPINWRNLELGLWGYIGFYLWYPIDKLSQIFSEII
jgi:hypothetical protein